MKIIDIEPENLKGEKTLNYKVEIKPNVFFSVVFVNEDLLPNETMRVFNGDLIRILDKIAFMFKKGVEIKVGLKLDFEIDCYEVADIYVNFKDNNINIEYSLL